MKFTALLLAAALAASTSAQAKLFTVTWSGAPFGNSATATGLFDLSPDTPADPTYIDNPPPPGDDELISLTVSGADSGNGSFVASDFAALYFSFYSKLDFSRELIGQVMENGVPFGSFVDSGGPSGDFNLFGYSGSAAPFGDNYFVLGTDHDAGDDLAVTSIRPVVSAAPEPMSWALTIGGLGLVGAAARRRKRVGSGPSPLTAAG